MKKIVGSVSLILLLTGCVNNSNTNIDNRVKEINLDKKLMKKYNITTDNLINFGEYYVFSAPSPSGTNIIFLDKNYNEVKKFSTKYFFDAKKIAVYKGKIYILGVNETTYYPELLVLDKNGTMIERKVIHKKFALPKDLFFKEKDIYILTDVFENGKSHIEIYKNGKLIKRIELKKPSNGTFVFEFKNDIFILGTVKNTTQDAFITNLSKGWIRFFDLGLDEDFDNYKISDGKIILNLHSTDQMGADSYYEIIINKDGKILKNECKMKFESLPMRFRT